MGATWGVASEAMGLEMFVLQVRGRGLQYDREGRGGHWERLGGCRGNVEMQKPWRGVGVARWEVRCVQEGPLCGEGPSFSHWGCGGSGHWGPAG